MCQGLTSSAETPISLAFSSASCLMNLTIWSICFSTCSKKTARSADQKGILKAWRSMYQTARGRYGRADQVTPYLCLIHGCSPVHP